MGVTIRDVAEASGVSLMAVSKVLHGRGAGVRVGEKTAEHIRKVAEQLGYRPNALARSLRLGKTDTIGLIFQGFENLKQGYYVELLHGIMTTAFRAGYSLTICPKLMNPDSPDVLNDGRFDGVIWSKMTDDENLVKALETSRIPIVVLHVPQSAGLKNVSTFCCDNDGGLELAVEHLYGLGHRRILFAYEHIHERLLETAARKQAFANAMAKRSLHAGPEDFVQWQVTGDEFADWWASKPPHTAIITRGEWFAGHILGRARGSGSLRSRRPVSRMFRLYRVFKLAQAPAHRHPPADSRHGRRSDGAVAAANRGQAENRGAAALSLYSRCSRIHRAAALRLGSGVWTARFAVAGIALSKSKLCGGEVQR